MATQTPTRAAIEQRHVRRVRTTVEQLPDAPDKLRMGRYSQGIEQTPNARDKVRIGRYCARCHAGVGKAEARAAAYDRGNER